MDKDIIYQKDRESYIHQNKLKWSRFQTISALEAAIFYALYNFKLANLDRQIFMIFGALLVFIVCLLCIRDRLDARLFLKRILKYERRKKPFDVPLWGRIFSGNSLALASIILINCFNLLMIIIHWEKI